jgi:hypothetical protein
VHLCHDDIADSVGRKWQVVGAEKIGQLKEM